MLRYTRLMAALTALVALYCAMRAPALAEYDKDNPQNLTAEHLFAESALLVDEDSGEALFSKNSRVRMYPASTTKIMTLLLALESDIPLDAQVTIPQEAADIPEGSSVIPVKPGDVMSFSDLLYGFMLSSGNDGANAIAVLVDGGIEPFVARMNERAQALGCEGTHYVNAHGYHNSEHYTTAQDLATIAREAMKNPSFREIVAAPRWTMSIQRGGSTVSTEIISRNSLLQSGEKYYYPDCTGIKTGHHNKAGWCFVGSAERDGKRVICVVLNCAEEMSKWYDAARLFEYGFTRYAPVAASELLEKSRERYARAQIEDAAQADPEGGSLLMNLTDVVGGDQAIQVVSGSEAAMSAALDRVAEGVRVEWQRDLVAPVSEGERMGTLTLNLGDGRQVTAALTASRSVESQPVATEAPTAAPTAQTGGEEAPDIATADGGSASRGSGAWIVALLIALLALAVAALAIASHRARLERERRRRRRRVQARAPQRRSAGAQARTPGKSGTLNRTRTTANRRNAPR